MFLVGIVQGNALAPVVGAVIAPRGTEGCTHPCLWPARRARLGARQMDGYLLVGLVFISLNFRVSF